ncbi:MAG: hypothetical protein K2H79_06565, partial [Bacteroidaceae bacterium]|nr:hypothetical protein [Bacteroidaceae bacterium]
RTFIVDERASVVGERPFTDDEYTLPRTDGKNAPESRPFYRPKAEGNRPMGGPETTKKSPLLSRAMETTVLKKITNPN